MSEQKPVSFKPKKPAKAASQPEVTEHVDLPEEKVDATPEQKDWDKAIAEAKAAKQQQEEVSEAEVDAAAERLAGKLTEKPEEPKQETPKTEEKKGDKPAAEEEESAPGIKHYWDETVGEKEYEGNPEYQPTEEEIARAKAIEGKKEHDASRVVSCQLGAEQTLVDAINKLNDVLEKYQNMTQEEIDANPEAKEALQWWADIRAVVESSLHTDQQKLLMGMVDALNKQGKYLVKLDKRLGLSKTSSSFTSNGQPKLLRGDAAMQIINSRYRGIYRIQLHNSGFWIKLTPLRNADVDAWMQEVDFERKQIGRIVGGHFYVGMNIYLKEKMADLLKLCVIDSNLENWKEGTTLVDSISIHDYDTLCWAFCTMMHKDGVNISTVCVNPDCKYHNPAQYLDLARMAYINPDVYTEEAMQWMIAGSAPGVIRTQKDIKDYKEKLLKNVRLINFTPTDQYELKDPSLGEFIRCGMATLGKMAAKVKDGKLTEDDPEVRRHSVYQLSKMLSPWISKIILNDEEGKVQGVIDDRDAITNNLETTMDDEYHVIERIEEFMTNSKVSFYAAVSLKCPKCGHQLNLLKDNIFPFDVEYLLFCLSYLKLDQIRVTL